MQGRLFKLSVVDGLDSLVFIRLFMHSEVAKGLDSIFHRFQWAGEEYLFEEIKDEFSDKLLMHEETLDSEMMYWIGYLYRYWHYYTGENSREIVKQAPAKTMASSYLMFHTMDPEIAIDNLKEMHRQKDNKQKSL